MSMVAPGALASLEVVDDIAVVRLERPEAMNAISGSLADALRDVLRAVGSRPDIKVMILTASGDDGFCAGADLKERLSFELEDFYANRRQMRALFQSVRELPQPSIAAVFGFAMGGGLELALSCDLIVAAEGTKLALPEARVGLIPAGGGTQLLPRRIGPARAKEMIFTGRQVDASEAAAMGLVDQVVPRADLHDASMDLAGAIGKSSPVAVREAKRVVEVSLGLALEDGIEAENDAWARVVLTEDREEGIAAFNEKRQPVWKNR